MSSPGAQKTEPVVGATYIDVAGGRELYVIACNPGDRLGREVIGLVSHHPRNGDRPADYATDLKIFAATWRLT